MIEISCFIDLLYKPAPPQVFVYSPNIIPLPDLQPVTCKTAWFSLSHRLYEIICIEKRKKIDMITNYFSVDALYLRAETSEFTA